MEFENPSHEIRNTLAKNAFEFLKKSADELGENPREASIHLCAGLELLLKARLAYEHWSLVDEHPGSTPLSNVKKGDFKSVSFQDAITRVTTVTGSGWSKDQLKILREAAEHRNRVLHFYHGEIDREREKVAMDLCKAWSVVQSRLDGPWRRVIPNSASKLRQLHEALKKVTPYLQTRFDMVKPKLDGFRVGGVTVEACDSCSFEAATRREHAFRTFTKRCLVCLDINTYLRFTCPNCGVGLELESDPEPKCFKCGEEFGFDTIAEELALDRRSEVNCAFCVWAESNVFVANDGSGAICFTCLETHKGRPTPCGRCGVEWIGYESHDLFAHCPDCTDAT